MEQASDNGKKSRVRKLLLPREHGAWGIFVIPLLSGAFVGLLQSGVRAGGVTSLLWFTAAALSLFCLRNSLEEFLYATSAREPADRRTAALVAALLALIALVSASVLLWGGRNLALLGLGVLSALLFLIQHVLNAPWKTAGTARSSRLSLNARMAGQMIAVASLSSTAAGAYYVVAGAFDRRALLLWLANCVFAANQVYFVQLRIHGSKLRNRGQKLSLGRSFLISQFLMAALLVLAWRFTYLPGAALIAFVPILVRGTFWFVRRWEPLRVRRLGLTELAHAVTFGVLLTASFLLAR